ncbi:diacylglycerol kinase [Cereibacter changlensis]|uniref:Diacylglycerol kinase n=1 Tax=Cereibacter changlensis TaxID=402884 RepID=A0A4U0YZ34_9RHOB|nr:diacylglycerol kinase [Cereibacter changlensis]TKA96209.1 diacylglycerol kinase [Cereibacter changlensis]
MTETSRPTRIDGPRHLLAAGSYSLGGLRRLWRETAFRHELAGGAMAAALLALRGAERWEMAVFAVLFLLLIAVEALNTAIEVLVDRVSPGWSEAARDAKDLGSLAVLCVLAGDALFLILALL